MLQSLAEIAGAFLRLVGKILRSAIPASMRKAGWERHMQTHYIFVLMSQ